MGREVCSSVSTAVKRLLVIHIQHHVCELALRFPFRLATGVDDSVRRTVIFHLGDGIGEATPVYYTGETIEAICDALSTFVLSSNPDFTTALMDAVLSRFDSEFPHVRAAEAAVDIAFHDLWGQNTRQPLYALLGTDPNKTPPPPIPWVSPNRT